MAALPHAHRDRSRPGPDLAYNRLRAGAARVFRLLPVHPGPDVSAAAVAALADLPVSGSHGALVCLAQAQLVEAVLGTGERWRMRDQARPHAQRLSDALAAADGRERARDRLLNYYLIVMEAADDQLRGLSPIPVQHEFTNRSGALTWLDAERTSLIAMVRMAADTGRDQAAKSLPLLMAYYLGFCGLFDDLLAVTMIGLHAARRLGDRTAESEALTNLGLGLHGLRRYDEAVTAHQDAAAIFRQVGDRHGEGNVLNNLGLALHGLYRDDEAVTAHQDAAAIFRQVGDRHGEGKALNNLGLALRGLRQFDDAATAHQDAVAIFRQTGDRHNEANALGNFGNVLQDLGLSQQAIDAYRKVVDIFRETSDHRSELMALQSLDLAQEAL